MRVSYQGLAKQLPSSLFILISGTGVTDQGPSEVRDGLLNPNLPFFLIYCPNIPNLPGKIGQHIRKNRMMCF